MTAPKSTKKTASTLIGAATRAGEFRTFLQAASAAGLSETLRSNGPFTLFAPTDDAFEAFPQPTWRKLMSPEHKELLHAVLSYHLAEGKVMAQRFAGRRLRGRSMEGGDLQISGIDGFRVNGAHVTAPDIEATNGVLHGIDRVLWPKDKTVSALAAVQATV